MKRLMLVLAVLLFATRLFAENITVVTLNVWSGLTYNGIFHVSEYEDRATREFRYDLLSRGLSSLGPDVIALQEANPLPAYANRIANDLTYDFHYDVRQAGVRIGPVGLPTNLREGDVILADTGFDLTSLRSTQLSGPGAGNLAAFQFGAGSQLTAARIEVADRPVYLFSTRWTPSPQSDRQRLVGMVDDFEAGEIDGEELLDLMAGALEGADRRLEEARKTLVSINEIAGEEPVILMGSFYAPPDSPEIQLRETRVSWTSGPASAGAADTHSTRQPTATSRRTTSRRPGRRENESTTSSSAVMESRLGAQPSCSADRPTESTRPVITA